MAVYRFADVEVDPEAFKVLKAGRTVRLEPKAVELLLLLVRQPGRLITKAEIQDAVWTDTAVTENALTRLVAQLRKALGDDAREARYIETVPTRGYRFVAEVGEGETPRAFPTGRWPGRRGRWVGLAVALLTLGAGALWYGDRERQGEPPAAPGPETAAPQRQVSTAPTLNVDPAFSPDGSTLAYASERHGSMEIVVRPIAAGAREIAVTSDGQQNVNPAWSPDGRFLAYHSLARGGIWVVPALGGVPRPASRFGSHPSWSPDGQTLAFQSQAWLGLSEAAPAAIDGSTLWVVPAAGGEPRPLTTAGTVSGAARGGHGGPRWSPDGGRIAFVAGGAVWSVRPDGSDPRRAERAGREPDGTALPESRWARGARVLDVAWTPEGSGQVWTGRRRGVWSVWRVAVDPETGLPVEEPEVIASGGASAPAQRMPAVSPDGQWLAYVTFRTGYELRLLALSPSGDPAAEQVSLVPGLATRKSAPFFSPDGGRLGFSLFRAGEGYSLWTMDLEAGGPPVQVTAAVGGDPWGAWFPDGRRILTSTLDQGRFSAWSVDLQTGHKELLLQSERAGGHIRLSPDGTALAMHALMNGALNVAVAAIPGGAPRPITEDREGAGWAAWAPDGQTLAVELLRGGHTRIALVPREGGPYRIVPTGEGQSWPFSFSPDGRHIAFAGRRDGVWNVYRVGVDGAPERALTSNTRPSVYVRYPAWSPQGDAMVYEYAESASTVWVTRLR